MSTFLPNIMGDDVSHFQGQNECQKSFSGIFKLLHVCSD